MKIFCRNILMRGGFSFHVSTNYFLFSCDNSVFPYECSCHPGFRSDIATCIGDNACEDFWCVDIDECTEEPYVRTAVSLTKFLVSKKNCLRTKGNICAVSVRRFCTNL